MSRFVAVTGAAGFIGRVVARKLLERGDYVYAIDALTYAADPAAIEGLRERYPDRFSFVCRDIRELGRWPDVDAVIHLAAETHVDNSLTEAPRFVETNVNGTLHLLEMTRAKAQHGAPFFVHVSTDEVYGPKEGEGAWSFDPLEPTSPYAASKAAADMLVRAWGKTYGIPYAIIRPTNCYGENQHPEKLVPKCVRSLMLGRPIPIHGDGSQTRCWLNVRDLADAILLVLDQRLEGIWNVGGNTTASVMEVATRIGQMFDATRANITQTGFVRPAMDQSYAVQDGHLRNHGWTPKGNLWRDLPGLVEAERQRFRF